ncbi:SE1832 family protein [Neobacillus mesonae]|uniref:SE1832 family protein n=1 Tax=Neobacillus mesonae TaxID=1193713 RepID=UPI0013DFADB5|nr:SE1832 family protein [Neobacillus mesonae]
MNRKDIEYKIRELKMDYVRLQNDLEKLESVNGNISPLEKQLTEIETELRSLNEALKKA